MFDLQEHPSTWGLYVVLHLVCSLLLAFTFRRFGIDLELSLLASLLFLMNVAHFRVVHWISCVNYTLALILVLGVLVSYVRYLPCGKVRWVAIASGVLAAAISPHPSTRAVALICAYLAWRRSGSVRQTALLAWPLVAAAQVYGFLTYKRAGAIQTLETATHLDSSSTEAWHALA